MKDLSLAVLLLVCSIHRIKCMDGEEPGTDHRTGVNNGMRNEGYGNGMNNGMNNHGVEGGKNNGNGNKGNMNGRNNGNDNYMPGSGGSVFRSVGPLGWRRERPTYRSRERSTYRSNRRTSFEKTDKMTEKKENESKPFVAPIVPTMPKVNPTMPKVNPTTSWNTDNNYMGFTTYNPPGYTTYYPRFYVSRYRGPSRPLGRGPSGNRGRGPRYNTYGYGYTGSNDVDSSMNYLDRFLERISRPRLYRSPSTRGRQPDSYESNRYGVRRSYRDTAARLQRAQQKCEKKCEWYGEKSSRCGRCKRKVERMERKCQQTSTASYQTTSSQ